MKTIYKIDGMTCNGCKASVEKYLSSLNHIKSFEVNLEKGEIEISSTHKIEIATLQELLPEKYTVSERDLDTKILTQELATEKSEIKQLFPLFLIFGYISISAFLINSNPFVVDEFMLDFMGLFYIIFSFFKFLDVKGFAMSFSMYDPLAKKVAVYGYVYPFLELMLGLLFLFDYQIQAALILTLVLLGITTVGVTKALLDKKSIQCACLGSVLNLPMTKATFIENSIMILMAIFMLMN